jgi:hypothetical protein
MVIPRDVLRDIVFAITSAVCAVLAIEFISGYGTCCELPE